MVRLRSPQADLTKLGVTAIGALAAACGGEAKGQDAVPTRVDQTSSTRVEPSPTAVPTPELSREEILLQSTEIRTLEEIAQMNESVYKIIAAKLPSDSSSINIKNDIATGLKPYDPKVLLQRNNHVTAWGNAAIGLSNYYCNVSPDFEVLELYHSIHVRLISEAKQWESQRIVPPGYVAAVPERYFGLTCVRPQGKS